MIWYVIIGFFAAVGVLALVWLFAGLFLPTGKRMVAVYCPRGTEISLLRRYRWLRELGLVRCTIVLLDSPLSEEAQNNLAQHFPGVSFCTTENWKQERK